ncbi:hypothetical protein Thimo_2359 [Thioflavicoccus mobilis 8321]|uniref:Uncharacterized protein n=1 Tax=Thioflavicoccus mobilis 8321 TaxID=765912 RepID=L0GYR2_9GAMM|nr:hypothetical protein [Thioflavicoccus mobilis]AGA91096.1 hypothetical protein Thimo_2359 [Thioflavicoccus mobilis 8321]
MHQPLRLLVIIALIGGALFSLPSTGRADPTTVSIPEALAPWVDWVLHDEERQACPLGSGGEGGRICAWPGRLELALDADGGRFEQGWELKAEAWVRLPGGDGAWPLRVAVDGVPTAVVEHDGRPAVRLVAGAHRLSGQFLWRQRPQVLAVPRETGLLTLRLDGEPIPQPRLDPQGRLWLGQRPERDATAEPDTLALEMMRRIEDTIPLQVRTRLALDVSGRPREVTLGPVPLPGGIPLRLDSPLPARLVQAPDQASGEDWFLQVQLRPGRWILTLDSHHPGPIETLALNQHGAPWPAEEVWAFAAQPDLRQVEVRGAELVDPRQTRLPGAWQRLPAYLVHPGQTLTLEPLRRGASGADRLKLQRELRLDYGGEAFSVRDRLNGRLEERWRLEAEPGLALGQVQVDGEPRFITRLPGDEGPEREGVEVRQGRLDLVADARIASGPVGLGVTLPASGWALPLDSVETHLHLPPGWDLLAAGGIDNLPDSWLGRWSLLDIFLVLVIALGTGRLWGWPWGLLALVTLTLVWQEPGAPRWVWLHVLIAAALVRLLPTAPTGKTFRTLRTLLGLYYRGALLALALIALPFLVTEMRDGLFPQLDRSGSGGPIRVEAPMGAAVKYSSTMPTSSDAAVMMDEAEQAVRKLAPSMSLAAPAPEPLPKQAPGALVQTGAGVPDWTWRSFTLSWSGPVTPEQTLRLWLLPPLAALLVAALRVVLVLLLGLRLADWLRLPGASARGAAPLGLAGLFLAGGLVLAPGGDLLAGQPAAATAPPVVQTPAAFPSPELLDELKRRLLEPPDCLPDCAEIPRLDIEVSTKHLRLLLEIDAMATVALPLPAPAGGWSPGEVLLDEVPLSGLRRDTGGHLLAAVPSGRHRLVLAGPLPASGQVDIPLPLRPRFIATRVAEPWRLEGVDSDGRPGDQLRLVNEQAATPAPADTGPALDGGRSIPPLLRITRTLRLGLDWTVETEVARLSPPESAVTTRVPLITGEAVTTPGLQVDDGGLLVSLPPGRPRQTWSSTLTPVDRLALLASDDPHLTEVWRLQVSPVWHLEASGVPPVQNLDAADRWLPTWRPWPGERLELALSRPIGVAGSTLTLDRSVYRLTPGRRASEATLELALRSSQGGRHRIRLPSGAELTGFTVDGVPHPLASQDRALDLPLVPGSQQIALAWREPTPLASIYRPAAVELDTAGVNAETQVRLGRDRWLLWTAGPGVGPAVLFWGLLIVLALTAALLARSPLTPLGFASWLLLGVGLSQAGVWVAVLVTLWLFALGLRRRLGEDTPHLWFNLAQVGLALLTIVALSALVSAVQQGLLGDPAMQVAGNGSSATQLNWYLDRQGPQTEPVTIISAPIWVYRTLMLAWALWLAWRLLDWLRWGWAGFAEPALWRQKARKTENTNGIGNDPAGAGS